MRVFSKDLLMNSGQRELPWVQPLLTTSSDTSTSVTTPEGTIYSCNMVRAASYAMSYAFDGIIPTTYSQCACFVRHTGQSNWVEVYNPNPIKVSQIIIYWSSGSTSTRTETINIEASNDGVNYVTLVNGATHNTNVTVNPHIIPVNNNDFYNYYKITNTTDVSGYWYVGEIEITATYLA